MNKLLILASGSGTRNAMFTYNNALPKCLTTVGTKTILESIIDSYPFISQSDIYIAVQTKHEQAVLSVLNCRGYSDVNVISYGYQPTAMQSLLTALHTMHDGLVKGDCGLYINWSDVFTANPMPIVNVEDTIIFTDKNYIHRNIVYDTMGGLVVGKTLTGTGNVPGIFHVDPVMLMQLDSMTIPKLVELTEKNDLYADFDRLLCHLLPTSTTMYTLNSLVDLGSNEKFTAYLKSNESKSVCRFFNRLTITDKYVYKSPVTETGIKLHKPELAYYLRYSDKCKALAKLISYDKALMTMQLERVDGITCQALLKYTPLAAKDYVVRSLIEKFNYAIAEIHSIPIEQGEKVSEEQLHAAIRNEITDGVVARTKPVLACLEAVQASTKTFAGYELSSYEQVISQVDEYVKANLDKFEFSVIHGDPNADNCLIGADGEMKFIDPRGYFGGLNILGFGPKIYDYAKFIYGLTGYSAFNSTPYITTEISQYAAGGNDIKARLADGTLLSPSALLQQVIPITDDKYSILDIAMLVGIIWLKLTTYIINDPMKAVAAYMQGNAIITEISKTMKTAK